MTTIRQHLASMHEKSAEHHIRMAKLHRASMGKADVDSDDEAFHKSAAAEHTEQAEYHVSCAKDLSAAMKAAGGDGGALMPLDGVSSVYRADPPRMVLRAGQRQPAAEAIDSAFKDFVKVD